MQLFMARTKKRKRFPFESPHFLRFIHQDSLESGKLVLPTRFIKMYRKKLSDLVSIKVPTGDVWEIELRSRNGIVWFEKKGWADFSNFYSLDVGSVLIFKYVQVEAAAFEFQVVILDKTTMEIDYPKINSTENIQLSDDDDDDSMSTKSESESSDHSSLPSFSPSKRIKFGSRKASCSSRLGKANHRDMGCHEHHTMKRTSQPSSGFISKFPFFQVLIRKGYWSHNTLSIPKSFMKGNYLNMKSKEQILTFKTEGGRSWPVKLRYYPPYSSNVNKMSAGLAAFFRENSVQVGDICTFELTDRKQKVFIVTISRAGNSRG